MSTLTATPLPTDVVPPSTATACPAPCPTCNMPCLGGPIRYRSLHMCRGRHQWGTLVIR